MLNFPLVPRFLRNYIASIVVEYLVSFSASVNSTHGWISSALDATNTTYNNVNTVATQANTALTTTQSLLDAAQANLIAAQTLSKQNQAAIESMNQIWLGNHAAAPTVDNLGNALVDGAVYRNTTDYQYYVYTASTGSWTVADNGFAAATQLAQTSATQAAAALSEVQSLSTQVQSTYEETQALLDKTSSAFTHAFTYYLAPGASNATVDNNGNAVAAGAVQYNSAQDRFSLLTSASGWVYMATTKDLNNLVQGTYGLVGSNVLQVKAINYNTTMKDFSICTVDGSGNEAWGFAVGLDHYNTDLTATKATLATLGSATTAAAATITDLNAAPVGWAYYTQSVTNSPDTNLPGFVQTISQSGSATPAVGNSMLQIATSLGGSPVQYARDNISGNGWSSWARLTPSS